ncbi:hypothetical protein Tco_0235761 [Tanacetum coccineum]
MHKIYTTPFSEDDLEEVLERWVGKVFTKFNVTTWLYVHYWKSTRARIYYWQCHNKIRSDPDEINSNRTIIDIVRVLHHEAYGHEHIDEVCVKRNNDKFYTFAESDFKYLNKNDIKDMHYISLRRRTNPQLTVLIKALIIFIISFVVWERGHDFQLGIKSYQMKINLTAPTITFPSMEKAPLYSTIGIPFVGIVYENSKNEKRAMNIEEL